MSNDLDDGMIKWLLGLPYEQRDQLAHALIDSLHPSGESITEDEWRTAWSSECHHRLSEMNDGSVETIPAHEFVARMRAKHGE